MRRVHCCVEDGDMGVLSLSDAVEQRSGDGLVGALFRDKQQAGQVGRDAGAAKEGEHGEGDAHDGDVDREVVGDARAHAGQHATVVGAPKRRPADRAGRGLDLVQVLGPGDVQHLHPGAGDRGDRAGEVLVERHLISREHAAKGAGSGLVVNKEESVCVMINEEDHLRMQALRPGLQLKQAWVAIDQMDSELERKLDMSLSELDLVVRVDDELLEVRDFDEMTLKEVKRQLAQRGLRLGMKYVPPAS